MPKARWQADMYLEGSDQHRGWFQSSCCSRSRGNGAAPFKTVLTTASWWMPTAKRFPRANRAATKSRRLPRPTSKNRRRRGAPLVASQIFAMTFVVSEERVNKVSETYRGIRNALALSTLEPLRLRSGESTPCPMTNSPASTAGFSA